MDTEEMMHWENVVALERAAYGEGQLVEEYTGQAVVLISNRKMEYSGIGLVYSSTSCPSPEAALSRATTFPQCVISSVSIPLFSYVYPPPLDPPISSHAPSTAFAFSFVASAPS